MNTIIESPEARLRSDAGAVIQFLSDLRNHEKLMPGQIQGFEATAETCRYEITGTGALALQRAGVGTDEVILEPVGKAPFPYRLTWKVLGADAGCKVRAVLEAEMNLLVRSIAINPLKNFLEMQSHKLAEMDAQNQIK